ncbi:MAG: ISAs1 family transposase [Deltaproteobacteria bacterium]|nr:ISAs1 family transposase [Deltaproteobacteria bacterium]
MATFGLCLSEWIRVYGGLDLFRMVAADAASCSLENASLVRSHRLHYLFALKSTQPTLYNEAVRLLGALDVSHALACSEDHLGGKRRVVRRLYLCSEMTGFHQWEHLRTVIRVSSQTFEHGTLTKDENRYLLCSLSSDRFSPEQWLKLVRQYWMVENGPHWTLDVPLQQDAHPWIESEPQGALVLALLRRVAYNMLSLFRAVTLRAEDNRATPCRADPCLPASARASVPVASEARGRARDNGANLRRAGRPWCPWRTFWYVRPDHAFAEIPHSIGSPRPGAETPPSHRVASCLVRGGRQPGRDPLRCRQGGSVS